LYFAQQLFDYFAKLFDTTFIIAFEQNVVWSATINLHRSILIYARENVST